MTSRWQLVRERLAEIESAQMKYEFPQLMMALREAHGVARNVVCRELGFSEMSLFCIENGYFKKPVQAEILCMFAEYYNVQAGLLVHKHSRFMEEGKGRSIKNYESVRKGKQRKRSTVTHSKKGLRRSYASDGAMGIAE